MMLAAAAYAAATPVISSGYTMAAAVLAALAITVAVFFTRKRLAWETCLDMPVGLATPHRAGTRTPLELVLGEPGLGPFADSTEQGWIVLLGITNPGCTRVRSGDFRTPPTFTFPSRQINTTRILPEPCGRAGRQTARAPAICLSAVDCSQSGSSASRPARIYLTGDYVLRPSDSYTVMLLLSGTPTAHTRIQQAC